VALIVTTALVQVFGLPVETIADRFGGLDAQISAPSVPPLTFTRAVALVGPAFTIALLAAIESLLSAVVADGMIGGKHRSNMELVAQGVANIASPIFGGMPATGAIARTATNVRAGGKTPVAGLVHALTILLVMMVAAPLAGYMAMPALAALLILTAWNMSEPHKWRGYLAGRASDRFLLLLTMVLTVIADLTVAIGVGVALGLALRMRRRKVPPSDWSEPER
jgi:SulP family sulfate permease